MSVLRLLEENINTVLSGQDIADKLGMTRANVWKEITKLRKEAYEIVAVPSKGYQLVDYGPNFSKYLLSSALPDLDIEIHPSLPSTNDFAKEGKEVNRLIIATTQSAGRGRMGKSFYSPENRGLYFSYVINPDLEIELIPLITIAAALAINQALPISSDIKWLNDILIENKKIAGILVEGDLELQTRRFNKIIVGVGINLFSGDNPSELENIMGALSDFYHHPIDKHQILIDFIKSFDQRLLDIHKDKDRLISDYRKLCTTLNKKIVYQNKVYKALDINSMGQLMVEDENKNQSIIQSGEIEFEN